MWYIPILITECVYSSIFDSDPIPREENIAMTQAETSEWEGYTRKDTDEDEK